MGAIEDTRKVLQDFLAPEMRELKVRVDALKKRMNERFDSAERRPEERHQTVLQSINNLANLQRDARAGCPSGISG